MLNSNHAYISYDCRYIKPNAQIFWGYDFDLLGSSDVVIVTWPFDSHCMVWCVGGQFDMTVSIFVSRTVVEIFSLKILWCHQSRDRWTRYTLFSTGGPSFDNTTLSRTGYYVSKVIKAYSHWKCIDLHFCVLRRKIGGYSILQLYAVHVGWALNRHNLSTGLVTAVFGPSD